MNENSYSVLSQGAEKGLLLPSSPMLKEYREKYDYKELDKLVIEATLLGKGEDIRINGEYYKLKFFKQALAVLRFLDFDGNVRVLAGNGGPLLISDDGGRVFLVIAPLIR